MRKTPIILKWLNQDLIVNPAVRNFLRKFNYPFGHKTRLKKTEGGAQKLGSSLLNGMVLSLLFVGWCVSAQSAPEAEESAHCPITENSLLHGSWALRTTTINPYPDIGLGPFPERITIDDKALTIKLRTQSKTKIYPLTVDGTSLVESLQIYDKPDVTFENREYTLKETAVISLQKGILTVRLTWTEIDPSSGEEQKTVTGSYQFCRDGSDLLFSRTNHDPSAEEPLALFRALYHKDDADRNLDIRTRYKERKGGE